MVVYDRGSLIVNLDAKNLPLGALSNWTNQGTAGGNDTRFSWSIASVKIYNHTLSPTQITVLAKETHSWTMLSYDDFEGGFGNYTDGGADCWIYSHATGANYARQENKAADVEANSGDASSFYHTSGIDVATPGYIQIKVDFWYMAYDLEQNEKFYVEYYNGSSWQIVATYTAGVDFVADDTTTTFYHSTITIKEGTYTFPPNMKLKFRCVASDMNDNVYIDEVQVLTR